MSEVSSRLSDTDIDPATEAEMVNDHIEELKQRELEKVFAKLEKQGTLTSEQKAQIEKLADNLTQQIIDPSGILPTTSKDRTHSVLILHLFDFETEIACDDLTD